MLDQVLQVFGVEPDIDLALMQANQTPGGFTSRAIAAIDTYLAEQKPDMVVVQGDTTTVFSAALAAFYHNIPVGHVEAGLRTWNKRSPFPEEINRVLTSRLADLHFAPTTKARENLIKESVPTDRIIVTGNTVIDALLIAVEKIKRYPPTIPGLPCQVMNASSDEKLVLITGHRRENFGNGFENICHAITQLANRFPQAHFVYPVHLNPNVREPVNRILRPTDYENIHLIEPLEYLQFVAMMNRSTFLLTDSGGVQEEAPSLGKPVLVMRNTTERPEGIEIGTVRLVGTDTRAIVENVSELLTDDRAYGIMANAVNPYGDGKACGRILTAIHTVLMADNRL